MSNREIATTLYMSTRSVEAHLTKTYRELGIRSRTQLAAALTTNAGQAPAEVTQTRVEDSGQERTDAVTIPSE